MSKPARPSDRLRPCAHCGVTFLWSAEEQDRALRDSPDTGTLPPGLCPGCRALLPEPGRERGLVKWFNRRRQYGFLVRANGQELFVHRSAVRGRDRLQPGQLVEFAVEETAKGRAAVAVTVLTPG